MTGKVNISPAKNACLPIIASATLFDGEFLLKKAPKITDVVVMAQIVEFLGGDYLFCEEGLKISTKNIFKWECDGILCKKARASFFIVGALLSRFKHAIIPFPGGCNIGSRPIDIHIDVLRQFGAEVTFEKERVLFYGGNMRSNQVKLSYPSVGATVNAICSAVFLNGESSIGNAAREPEIVDLCNFLIECGCKIDGVGKKNLTIKGVNPPKNVSVDYLPIKDRIEAGTFMCMTAITGGDIIFSYEHFAHLKEITAKLRRMGVAVAYKNGEMRITSDGMLKGVSAVADVYPRFPTDMQSIYCAVCAFANGKSRVKDKVFQNRFEFIKELKKMGADVTLEKEGVTIRGNDLVGSKVFAPDLRAGAALVCAGLGAKGVTVIENADIVSRGYENIHKKITSIGGKISFIK